MQRLTRQALDSLKDLIQQAADPMDAVNATVAKNQIATVAAPLMVELLEQLLTIKDALAYRQVVQNITGTRIMLTGTPARQILALVEQTKPQPLSTVS